MKNTIIRLLTLLFLLLVLVTFLVLNIILGDRISDLEDKSVLEHTIQAQNEIYSELRRLSLIAGNWSMRDDTFAFMQNRNAEFVTDNLGQAAFTNLEIDLLALVGNDHSTAFIQAFDQDSQKMSAVSQSFRNYLAQSPLIGSQDPDYPLSGILLLPEGPLLIAAGQVQASGGQGPANGTLILGEYLNAGKIRQIARKLKLDIQIETLTAPAGTAGGRDLSIVVQAMDAGRIEGRTIIRDIDGQPVLRLTVGMDREVGRIGRAGIYYALIALVAASLIFMLTIWLYFDRRIISRLKGLAAAIIRIGQNHALGGRLPEQPVRDEIAVVSDEINVMLDKLAEAQIQIVRSENALKEANAGLETKIRQRTADLEASNSQLQNEIQERQKAQDDIRHLAYHDLLTNLPNRLMFTEHLNHAINLASRSDKALAIIFLDLDSFKMINDTMGHAAGDRLLQEVAGRLADTLRKSDIISRIGGDEFIALIENLDERDAVKSVTEKILASFHEPFMINGQHFFLTTSIGVSLYPADGLDAETIIKNADIAMYKAKELGKNQYVFCSPVMKAVVTENVNLTNQLHLALERQELELYYQPQIRCDSSQIVGVEALLRWHHPVLGMVSPAKFIPLAEQSGVIIPIGEWVLRMACRQCALWHRNGFTHIRMGVNLSIKQFQCSDLVSVVRQALDDSGLPPRCLELEITESIAMKGNRQIIRTLQALEELGISIAVDDFGTEYSSLNYLKQLPIKALKIALPFVQGINVSKKDEAITKAVIALAKSLGLELIAEGVETKSQLDFLTERFCDEVQGYYYYKPMTSQQFDELLRRGAPFRCSAR